MTASGVEIQIEEPFIDLVDADEIERLVTRTLTAGGVEEPAALTVVITHDATIQRLNREYLGIDAPTDVLAFSQSEGAEVPSLDDGPRYLGDVVVSYERAVTQAEEYDEPVERELSRLVVHGALHLLGYDDQDRASREDMWEVQEWILDFKGEENGL